MALKANTFTESLDAFLDEIVILSHYQFFISWHLRESRNGITRTLQHVKSLGHKGIGSGGSALGIINIFDKGDFEMHAPVGGRVTKSSDLLRLSEEIERRFNASLMVSLHEHAEEYFKRQYGLLLHQLRTEGPLRHKANFHKSQPKWARNSGTPGYFLAYSKHACRRDCDPALADFEKHLDWKLVAISKWGNLSFRELFETIGYCRHAIVHKEGRVLDDELRTLSRHQQTFVRSCLQQSLLSKHKALLPASKSVDRLFEVVASIGWGLYVLLSRRCGMKIDREVFAVKSA